ncbi:hypothetical protein HMPREF9094_0961 [Fusobacterium animalis ATCC 51191]|uniref:Lipoprotein n=1 Tax=Fusobacterium animalis ATCC 51191 TaxID=997347 RepID=F9EM06_9FUSO|nr:hypothetical protein HMPREF9094_0961 [Fusobacterium animalis ATCC 51191]
MKIIKRGLLFVLMLFVFTSCSLLFPESEPEVTSVNSVSPFTKSQKSVYIEGATVGVEKAIKSKLVQRNWRVSTEATGNETFAIVFDQLNIDKYEDGGFISTTYHEFTGYVSIFDVRNNKRLYVYDFTKESLDELLRGIEKGMSEVEKSMR